MNCVYATQFDYSFHFSVETRGCKEILEEYAGKTKLRGAFYILSKNKSVTRRYHIICIFFSDARQGPLLSAEINWTIVAIWAWINNYIHI